MTVALLTPDEVLFRTHIAQGPFQSGEDRQRWRLLKIEWPHVVIAVRAGQREGAPAEYAFRFNCLNYPQSPPTAQPWDAALNQPLSVHQWPTGRSRLPLAFNPGWKEGQCLYLPCDRMSIEGHDGWRTQHPSMIWSSTGDITQYLKVIYELLNSHDYTGTRRA